MHEACFLENCATRGRSPSFISAAAASLGPTQASLIARPPATGSAWRSFVDQPTSRRRSYSEQYDELSTLGSVPRTSTVRRVWAPELVTLPPAERARLLAEGYDSADLDLQEGHLAWEEEDDGLDFGGVPMRDEGDEDW